MLATQRQLLLENAKVLQSQKSPSPSSSSTPPSRTSAAAFAQSSLPSQPTRPVNTKEQVNSMLARQRQLLLENGKELQSQKSPSLSSSSTPPSRTAAAAFVQSSLPSQPTRPVNTKEQVNSMLARQRQLLLENGKELQSQKSPSLSSSSTPPSRTAAAAFVQSSLPSQPTRPVNTKEQVNSMLARQRQLLLENGKELQSQKSPSLSSSSTPPSRTAAAAFVQSSLPSQPTRPVNTKEQVNSMLARQRQLLLENGKELQSQKSPSLSSSSTPPSRTAAAAFVQSSLPSQPTRPVNTKEQVNSMLARQRQLLLENGKELQSQKSPSPSSSSTPPSRTAAAAFTQSSLPSQPTRPIYTKEHVNSMLATQRQLLLENDKELQSQKSLPPSSCTLPFRTAPTQSNLSSQPTRFAVQPSAPSAADMVWYPSKPTSSNSDNTRPINTKEQANSMLATQRQLLLKNAKELQSQKSPPPSSSTPPSRKAAAQSNLPSQPTSCGVVKNTNNKSCNEPMRPLYPSLNATRTPLQPTYQPQVVNNTPLIAASPQSILPPHAVTYTNYYIPTNNVDTNHQPQPNHQPQMLIKPSTAPKSYAGDFVGNEHQRFAVQPLAPSAADMVWYPSKPTSSNSDNTRTFKPNVSCVTCKKSFGLQIYQCGRGHSSCETCKMRNVPCGICCFSMKTRGLRKINNTRDFEMEKTLEQILQAHVVSPCPNKEYGCILSLKSADVQSHLLECPYSEIVCPVATMLGTACYWKGDVSQIVAHFKSYHFEHCQGDVDKEMLIFNIEEDFVQIHLVKLGIYKFLLLLKIAENRLFMTVQFLGTKFSADKWTYEFHVYNKNEPWRKYQYNNSCQSLGTPLREIFECNNACLPLEYASTFSNKGSLAYKFYIKKTLDRSRGRGGKHGGCARPTAYSNE